MLPRPAAVRRSTPRPGRWGRLGDAGQATLEYTGAAVLVGAVVLALAAVPVAPQLAEALRLVVCQITGGDCATGTSRVPRCVLSTRGESVASSGHLLVELGEKHGSDVELLGDGSANLITDNGLQAGVQAAAGVKLGSSGATTTKTGPSGKARGHDAPAPEKGAAGKDGPVGGTEPREPGAGADGGAQEAGPKLAELQAVLGLEGTASVSAVRTFAGQDDLLDYQDGGAGAGQRTVDVVTGIGGRSAGGALDSALRGAGLKAEDTHPPDAYRVKVGAAVVGDAGADLLGATGAQAGFRGGRDGTLEWRPDSGGFTYTGAVEGSAMAGASFARWGGAGEGVASAEVTIAFDEDMSPTDLTFLGDTENTRDGEGSATTRTSTLHLQDSDRAAVLAAMPALVGAQDPVSIAGSTASLAYLGQRMDRDGVEAKATWDVSGTETDTGWTGALLAKVGVSRVRTTDERTVKSMEYRDHGQGDTTWKKVPSCP